MEKAEDYQIEPSVQEKCVRNIFRALRTYITFLEL